jgi:hypothetical protein
VSNAFTLTPAGSTAIGGRSVEPKRLEPEQWLVERHAEGAPAADEVASLMWNHAKALDEIMRLRAWIKTLLPAKESKYPADTLIPTITPAARSKAYRERKAAEKYLGG